MAEEFRKLPGPMEFLEIKDRESVDIKVVSWERGTTEINTLRRGREVTVEIPILRVHVPVDVKALAPHYYDVSSKTLMAQWIPLLARPDFKRWTYRIQAFGLGVRKRFSLERFPL